MLRSQIFAVVSQLQLNKLFEFTAKSHIQPSWALYNILILEASVSEVASSALFTFQSDMFLSLDPHIRRISLLCLNRWTLSIQPIWDFSSANGSVVFSVGFHNFICSSRFTHAFDHGKRDGVKFEYE